ncbi:hypothetical protein PVAP13_1NG035905 [Panicum virgatum]|uniref:Uncharacterized protein n=1 Tax=Panicum virgatum TaxID=38727 RepID=A0A8T0WTA9_PANVG|nr:hypothetical protein PVAP13_1NG035905 [Panicum virgatum]
MELESCGCRFSLSLSPESKARVGQPMEVEGSTTRPRQRTAPTATATRVVGVSRQAAAGGGRETDEAGGGGTRWNGPRPYCAARRGAGAFSLSSRRGSAGRRWRPLRLRPRRHPAKSGADGITARSARACRGLVPRGMRRPPDWRRKQVWLARHGGSTHATRPRRGSASRLPTRHLPPPCRHLSTSRRLSTGQKLPPIPANPRGRKSPPLTSAVHSDLV